MKLLKTIILPIMAAGLWIRISEFFRNELLFKSYWTDHYGKMGLIFPSEPLNGAIWGLWSLCLAIAIFIINKKFSVAETTFISWFVGFVLMWLVTWNMSVLPIGILVFAIPLSLLEVFIAAYIIGKMKS